jgi:hypothetical protein
VSLDDTSKCFYLSILKPLIKVYHLEMEKKMKHSTVATALFSVSMLTVWVGFQLLATSFVKTRDTADQPLSIHRADNEAYVPVTGVEARTIAPAPVYGADGRIVSLNPNGSGNSPVVLVPVANVKVAPVYDASGALVSDPTGTVANADVKIAPVYDVSGRLVSDPTGTIWSSRNP